MPNPRLFVKFSSTSYSQFLNSFSSYSNSNTDKELLESHADKSKDQLYLKKYRKARIYRFIFLCFSFLFLFLAGVVYFKTTNWACSLYFSNCELVKASSISICLLLASLSLVVSYKIKPEREAVNFLAEKIRSTINQIYQSSQIRLKEVTKNQTSSLKSFPPGFKTKYYETLDHIQEKQDKVLHVLESIALSNQLNAAAKKRLFNQALLDFQMKLNEIVQAYKKQTASLLFLTYAEH